VGGLGEINYALIRVWDYIIELLLFLTEKTTFFEWKAREEQEEERASSISKV
jgi:hypothetical protein